MQQQKKKKKKKDILLANVMVMKYNGRGSSYWTVFDSNS